MGRTWACLWPDVTSRNARAAQQTDGSDSPTPYRSRRFYAPHFPSPEHHPETISDSVPGARSLVPPAAAGLYTSPGTQGRAAGVEIKDSVEMPVSKLPKAKRERDCKRNTDKAKAQPTECDVCAICDEGGSLICCDGGCLRSFHPTRKVGKESKCTTIGLTEEQWQTLESSDEKYICQNCKSKQHQCFSCGLLGSSDLTSGTEVFQCKDKQCARFYHPKCVAEVLYPHSKSQALGFGNDVASGLEFHCPMHRCSLCKEAENRDDKDMRLAVCGRCPTAYHRKCLPREISFKENKEKGIQKRAWDDVLPDQDFIYCMKHKMEKDLRTPRRDHIVFPDTRNPCAAKRPRGQETLKEDMIDRPSPSRSPQKTEAGCDRVKKPIDSFAPRHLFPRPHPGSCGWLDD